MLERTVNDWSPQGVFRCVSEDAKVSISVATGEEWRALCKVNLIVKISKNKLELDFSNREW